MQLRNATVDDSKMLFNWANDIEVRNMAFSEEPLVWESHDAWYRQKLQDSTVRIFILLDDDLAPVGQIRFDIGAESKAEVDVHTKPGLRGKGIGRKIIEIGTDKIFEETEVLTVLATIKQGNAKSIHAFSSVGYQHTGKEIIDGVPCCHLLKTKDSNPS